MAKFIYALRQRVVVPGVIETQGIVTQRTESIAGPNQYFVEYLTTSGQRATLWTDEADLVAVNGGLAPAAAPPSASEGPARQRPNSQPANLQLAGKPVKRKAKKKR